MSFCWDLAQGRCVGVSYGAENLEASGSSASAKRDHDPSLQARPEEWAFASTLPARRRLEWLAGRMALRRAASDLGLALGSVLPDAMGRPLLPESVCGSISHQAGLAVALCAVPDASRTDVLGLGVDVERRAPARPGIARLVLRPGEQRALAGTTATRRWEALLLRFSVKEALYKALCALALGAWDWQDAAVTPQPDGSAMIALHRDVPGLALHADGTWRVLGDLVLCTARVLGAASRLRELRR